MPSWAWILMWVLLVGVVAALYVRERIGQRTAEGDRFRRQAVRDADRHAHLNGPHGGGQTWIG